MLTILASAIIALLRHYQDVGLLQAQAADATTGCRYYSAGQLDTLNRTLVYRSLGFSLREISEAVPPGSVTEVQFPLALGGTA